MKRGWNVCLRGLILGIGLGLFIQLHAADVSVGVNISAPADFYAPLTPEGGWVEIGGYGHCWRPTHVEVGWRPYCDGEWVWTDAGWYWESDEPWGWACYHYGNWVYTDDWYWCPGVEWAPAWVEWRTGGGYCGWAPRPPRGHAIVDANFVFIDEHHFNDRHHPKDFIVNDRTVITRTKIVDNERRESRTIDGKRQRIMVNNGPDVKEIQKATGHEFKATSVTEVDKRTFTKAPPEIQQRKGGPVGNNNKPTTTGPDHRPAVQQNTPVVHDEHNIKTDIKTDEKLPLRKVPDDQPRVNVPEHDVAPKLPDHPHDITPNHDVTPNLPEHHDLTPNIPNNHDVTPRLPEHPQEIPQHPVTPALPSGHPDVVAPHHEGPVGGEVPHGGGHEETPHDSGGHDSGGHDAGGGGGNGPGGGGGGHDKP